MKAILLSTGGCFCDEGKDIAALEAAQRAMVHYKNALSIALRAAKVGEVAEDREQALKNQIDRLVREADRLDAILANVIQKQKRTLQK